jgi:hypothetical protein
MKFLVGSGYTRFADEVEKRVRMKGFWAVVAVVTPWTRPHYTPNRGAVPALRREHLTACLANWRHRGGEAWTGRGQ